MFDDVLEISHAQAVVNPVNITASEAAKPGQRVAPRLQAHGVAGGGLIYGPLRLGGASSGGATSGGAQSGGAQSGGKHKLKA